MPADSKTLAGVTIKIMPEQFYAVRPGRKISIVWLFVVFVILAAVSLSALYLYRDNATPLPVSQMPLVQTPSAVQPSAPELALTPLPDAVTGLTPSEPVSVVETPASQPVATAPTPVPAAALVSTQDSDSDKLTDIEEELYNSDPKLPDTESDGHLDGNEVAGLFDPSRPSPASLESSGLVKIHKNDQWQYTIFYPAKWTARPIDSEQREVMFSSRLGEFIEVLIQENLEKLPLADWYQKQSSGVTVSSLESFVTKRSIKAVRSIDGLTYYLAPDGQDMGTAIYAISYNAGTTNAYNYLTTLRMMINSFAVTQIINRAPASVPESTPPSQVQTAPTEQPRPSEPAASSEPAAATAPAPEPTASSPTPSQSPNPAPDNATP